MAIRWRWPPEKACGKTLPGRAIETDRLEQQRRVLEGLGPGRREAIEGDRLGERRLYPDPRVEGGIRILEDHLQGAAQARAGFRPDGLAAEADRPGIRSDEARDGVGDGRLPQPELADEAEDLPRRTSNDHR